MANSELARGALRWPNQGRAEVHLTSELVETGFDREAAEGRDQNRANLRGARIVFLVVPASTAFFPCDRCGKSIGHYSQESHTR